MLVVSKGEYTMAMQSLQRSTFGYRRLLRAILLQRRADGKTLKRGLSSHTSPPSFGIAFDIDGVLLKGSKAIGGAPQALRKLYENASHPAQLRVPYVFLTNGGGTTEAARALELREQLGVPVFSDQVLLGHTPFKSLLDQYREKRILVVGKGEPDIVLTSYGFQQVIHMDSYVQEFEGIDPLACFKPWLQPLVKEDSSHELSHQHENVAAVFIVSDPVDWGRDLQVICDVLRSGGQPGERKASSQTPIYFAADDLEYQSAFPVPRLGMGAFRVALKSIYYELHLLPLIYESFGKPQLIVYKDAEKVLRQIQESMLHAPNILSRELMHGLSFPPPAKRDPPKLTPLKTIYMVGDNLDTDIKGAKQAGKPWFAILTRTGCYPDSTPLADGVYADKVVDDVEEAIHFIFEREGLNWL